MISEQVALLEKDYQEEKFKRGEYQAAFQAANKEIQVLNEHLKQERDNAAKLRSTVSGLQSEAYWWWLAWVVTTGFYGAVELVTAIIKIW